MSIGFIHAPDIHFDGPNKEAALKSMREILRVGLERKVNFWAFPGDLYGRGVQNADASGFPEFVIIIRRMLDVAPIVAVEGTRTRHDLPGCYKVLTQLGAANDFFLLGPGETIILDVQGNPVLVMGSPEPNREWLVAQAEGLDATQLQGRLAEEMHNIFLGLGVKRREHPDMPAVMLYHGAIVGALMENQKPAAGEIAVGRDDLALCQADYIALGHIHKRQQIPGLPAWYCDSAYFVDWGEKGRKYFNYVELQEKYAEASDNEFADHSGDHWIWEPTVEAVSYPHPPRRKIEAAWGDDLTPLLPFDGELIWLFLKTPRDYCTSEHREGMMQKLRDNGALEGSRVTLAQMVTETVRAAEIAKSDRLEDKLRIWAEASGVVLTQGIFDKAAILEHNAERSGLLPTSFLYHLRSVFARGAKGIWKGLRVDDVFLDFDRLDPGLIALLGFNGEGKTTFVENCHPYSRMMTREGVLQDHFRLRDSLREVVFSNDATGTWYRSRMEIDGKNKSGQAKYHLAQRVDGSEMWVPMTDGTKDSYDSTIVQLLGSFELFTRSAFIPQRPTKTRPALYEATEGQKADLFAELAGLDYLQGYTKDAGATAKNIEDGIETNGRALAEMDQKISEILGLESQVAELASALEMDRTVHQTNQRNEQAAQRRTDELETQLKAQLLEEEKLRGINERITQAKREGLEASAIAAAEKKVVAEAPDAQKRLVQIEELRTKEAAENECILAASKKQSRVQGEWTRTLTAHQAHVAEIEGRASELRTQKVTVEGDQKALRAQIDPLIAELVKPLADRCPRCGQVLPAAELLEEKRKRKESEDTLKGLQGNNRALELRLESIAADLKAIAGELAALTPPTKPAELEKEVDDSALEEIRRKIAELDPEGTRKTVESAQKSQAKIEEAERTMGRLRKALAEKIAERDLVAKKIDAGLRASVEDAKATLKDWQKNVRESAVAVVATETRLASINERIAALSALTADRMKCAKAIEQQESEAREWRLLERACGIGCIQNLELGAMGPSISEIANKMLRSAYGSRFSIDIRTDRIAGKGKDAHERPTFQIWILDSECPEIPEAEFSNMSGGEATWIIQNIAEAFTIIREQRHGMKPMTVFKDEGDSALDDDPRTNSRQRYFDMLESGHAEEKRIQTLVVTHSNEAKDRIRQKITMQDLVRKGRELSAEDTTDARRVRLGR